ncbi:MAG: hypothetical protein OXH73_17140, partial [Caldilineaceae bacterium]|nr:hypothetical protein [Caldilineaceae bacterium]
MRREWRGAAREGLNGRVEGLYERGREIGGFGVELGGIFGEIWGSGRLWFYGEAPAGWGGVEGSFWVGMGGREVGVWAELGRFRWDWG